ncbi:hypothetical protein Back2_24190 [Nocardioides baekrokdamisoli]|uniref:Uncharacterized protein n=1 Tax=Nocardioides baekrokdamisoli TaxID=1804624 RepID=A0A3G9IIY4_9ACTN|nr:hypothetical protein Back2_24190 [Nocardioides baekrokdamisoli]
MVDTKTASDLHKRRQIAAKIPVTVIHCGAETRLDRVLTPLSTIPTQHLR